MQLGIREPIGSSLGESSIRARWVYGEPATRSGGFDGRALFRCPSAGSHEPRIESGH
jgi:hypothetical protein